MYIYIRNVLRKRRLYLNKYQKKKNYDEDTYPTTSGYVAPGWSGRISMVDKEGGDDEVPSSGHPRASTAGVDRRHTANFFFFLFTGYFSSEVRGTEYLTIRYGKSKTVLD